MTEPERSTDRVASAVEAAEMKPAPAAAKTGAVQEIGGPGGLEPTRYGDWERKGRCIDF